MQKIEIAKVLKPQGIKGEIKVECFTSDLDFLKNLKEFYIQDTLYKILKIRFSGKYAFITVDGLTDRNAAELLRNKVLLAEKSLAEASSSDDEYFISDLEDCCVVDENGNIVGYVESVEKYGSADIINILLGGAIRSFPFLKSVLKEVDIKEKKIVVFKNKLDEVLI
ncbi:MAG: 16S rRNA processing protein RimM [Clostridia bacterium]|nr:16S rRNA processing protein RimM [Clostridia bacterium]